VYLCTRETRPAGPRVPLAESQQVLLGKGRDARFFAEQRAHGFELPRMEVGDGAWSECELLRVAHPAVRPRAVVGFSTAPTYITIARTPSPDASRFLPCQHRHQSFRRTLANESALPTTPSGLPHSRLASSSLRVHHGARWPATCTPRLRIAARSIIHSLGTNNHGFNRFLL